MAQMTILDSQNFWDELMKRSPVAEQIIGWCGRFSVKSMLGMAFELKQEYEAKEIQHEHGTDTTARG